MKHPHNYYLPDENARRQQLGLGSISMRSNRRRNQRRVIYRPPGPRGYLMLAIAILLIASFTILFY
jgi:hypothetical protein